jgi:hypothetical protein
MLSDSFHFSDEFCGNYSFYDVETSYMPW